VRAGTVVAAIAAVAFPVYTLFGVSAMSEETGYLTMLHQVCGDLGPHAAVVVIESAHTDGIDDWIPQALRSWCGADVAIRRGAADVDALHRLSREWAAQGRQFFVASSSYGYVKQVVPDARIMPTRHASDTNLLAPTLTHRPDAYVSQSLAMMVASVPPS
jgi:hypothetical protein